MILKDFELNNYLFSVDKQDAPARAGGNRAAPAAGMAEIFYGENLRKGLRI